MKYLYVRVRKSKVEVSFPLYMRDLLIRVTIITSFEYISSWGLRSSAILRSVVWQFFFFTEVLGQNIGVIFKGQEVFLTPEDGTPALYRNFGK
jgi:hypothetical protein